MLWRQINLLLGYAYEYGHSVALLGDSFVHLDTVPQTADCIRDLRQNPFYLAYDALCTFNTSHCCASPICNATFAGKQRKFKRCSGCLRTPYCSSECQQYAWDHTSIPHRAVCKALRRFAAHAQLPSQISGNVTFELVQQTLATQSLDAQIEATGWAAKVATHMDALQSAKTSPPSTFITPLTRSCISSYQRRQHTRRMVQES